MTILKLAWRLGFSGDPRQRWRQVSVVVVSLVISLAALLAVGLTRAAAESDTRIAARTAGIPAPGAPARVMISLRGLQERGVGQFPVVWLEPVVGHERDPQVVPPGLSRLPGAGEGVLSPGLVSAGLQAGDFGLRTSTAGSGPGGAIGGAGVATQSEGWIYARPAPGRTLGTGGALLASTGYGTGADGYSFETIPQLPSHHTTLIGVLCLLVGPGAYLLFSGARAMSPVRDARSQTLWRLGVSPARIRILLATETTLLALAGAVPGLLLWQLFLSHATRLPLTVAVLKPGALSVGFPTAALVAALVVAVAAFGASLVRIRDRSLDTDARTVRAWHASPLVAGFTLMAASHWLSQASELRVLLVFGGLLLTLATLPLAIPALVSRLGAQLGTSRHPAVWLSGRRLALRSTNLSKPAAMVAALIFLAGAAFALYANLVISQQSPVSAAPYAAYQFDWRDPEPADATVLAHPGRGLVAVPMSQDARGRPILHFSDCRQAATALRISKATGCGAGSRLTPAVTDSLARWAGATATLAPAGPSAAGYAFVFGPHDTPYQRVIHRLGGLPAANLSDVAGVTRDANPLAGLTLAGWSTATLLLALALLREIGDRALSSMQDSQQLLRLGLRRREIKQTYRWTIMTPVIVAIPLGYLGAFLFAILGYELGVTINNLARIGFVASVVTAIALVTLSAVFRLQERISGLSR